MYLIRFYRNVKIPSLNNSEYIGLTVYIVLITTLLHFTLANVISEKITLVYVTSTSLILFTTTLSMCLQFLPKIKVILESKNGAEKQVVSSSDLMIESNTIRYIHYYSSRKYFRNHSN